MLWSKIVEVRDALIGAEMTIRDALLSTSPLLKVTDSRALRDTIEDPLKSPWKMRFQARSIHEAVGSAEISSSFRMLMMRL